MIDQKIFIGIPAPSSENFHHLVLFCEAQRGRVLASLPATAGELARTGGFAGMLLLIREHGGTSPYWSVITRHLGVGMEEIGRLIDWSTDATHIELPSASGVMEAIRRVAVEDALENGVSRSDAARTFGVTARYVTKLRRRQKVAAP